MLKKPKFALVHPIVHLGLILLLWNLQITRTGMKYEISLKLGHTALIFCSWLLKQVIFDLGMLIRVSGERMLPIGLLVIWTSCTCTTTWILNWMIICINATVYRLIFRLTKNGANFRYFRQGVWILRNFNFEAKFRGVTDSAEKLHGFEIICWRSAGWSWL